MIKKLLIAAILVTPILILIPGADQFYFQSDSAYSDIVISHYPNGLFVQRVLTEWGRLPLWSPAILSGYPFAANPLSGLFYLPGWLALAFPLPLGFHLAVILHLLWGAWGTYLLLRSEGLGEAPAVLGGLLFASSPKLFAHLGAGHLTLLYAVCWTPWLLYAQCLAAGCLLPAALSGAARLAPGLVLGTIALADPRWAPFAGLVWLAFSLRPAAAPRIVPELPWRRAGQMGLLLAGNAVLAALIAAPLLLPLLEYARLSTRAALTPADSLTYSLNPLQLLGIFFPYLRAPAEWAVYPGAAAAALFCLALLHGPLRRRAAFWIVLVIVSLLYALGSYLPPLAVLAGLPGLDLLRVPPRAVFLAALGFAAAAAYAFDSLLRERQAAGQPQKERPPANLGMFGVWVFVLLVGLGVALTAESDTLRLQFCWGTAAFSAAALLIFLTRGRFLGTGALTVLLVALAAGELSAVNAAGLVSRPFAEVVSEGAPAAAYLATRDTRRPFRVYSPSYSLPQQTAALYRLELADGVDPLQLAAYAGYMEQASGVPSTGYSVTLPPFASADPAVDNRGYTPDARRLGLLNVQFVVAGYALPGSGLRLLARFGETRIYENPYVLPRAWVQPETAALGTGVLDAPAVVAEPNRVIVPAAQGEGLLVLSEIWYPGWTVQVDGQPAALVAPGGLLRGVRLGPGEHAVTFSYRPPRLAAGLALAGLAWLVVLAVVIRDRLPRGGRKW